MIKAVIVDDEEKSRRVLTSLLQKFFPSIELCGEADNVGDAYAVIVMHKPDLVFLDIQMPAGNGFELLKKFEALPFDVIFVTGYDQYAINAIRFSALDYLLKPVSVTDLVEAVEKAVERYQSKQNTYVQIGNLLQLATPGFTDKKIPVHKNEHVSLVSVAGICYIEGDGRYCHFTVETGEKYTVAKTLKEFEEFLSDNRSFVRISKECMINVVHIRQYSKTEPCTVTMRNDKTFEVSRRKKTEVLDRLRQTTSMTE